MTALIAVTGATGVVGGGVARRLATAGIEQRLIVRSPNRTPALPGAQIAVASYDDGPAALAALAGIETLFMVSGAEEPNRLAGHRTFIDAAAAAGVRRIVYTSFFGASATCTFLLGRDHWHTEQHIRSTGMEFTFLRDNLYADVFLDFAGPEGVLRGPAGNGRISAVARADVIDAAVAVLQASTSGDRSPHDGVSYGLTGPTALSLTEIADVITRVTGRQVRYQAETVDEAYASREIYGAAKLAGRRLGQHLHGHRGRRTRRGHRRRTPGYRAPAAEPGGTARGLAHFEEASSRAIVRLTWCRRRPPGSVRSRLWGG